MRSKEKTKKCKGQESIIGKIIYSFLLFLPLFAIGTTCLISTFNMTSKEESEIIYKYETNEVNSANDLIVGRIYHYKRAMNTMSDYVNAFYSGSSFNIKNSNDFNVNINEDDELIWYRSNSGTMIANLVSNNQSQLQIQRIGEYIEIDLIFTRLHTNDNYEYYSISNYNVIDKIETQNVDTQDVFYRAINKVTESPLFNWAENSIIYSTTETTCTTLSITTPFIPLLLSYWLIISVIYFLYDIALMLVWIIHRKIHELQDSI